MQAILYLRDNVKCLQNLDLELIFLLICFLLFIFSKFV